jgi:hypothetical protein
MGKTIGIKLADGSFSPIIESGAEGSKTLNLTTVRDDQTEVHIDLFSSDDVEMKEAEYVATLQLERLEPRPAGELDVNFLISIDENDTLSAEITEPKSGSRSVKQIPQISQITPTVFTPDFTLVEPTESTENIEEIKPTAEEEKIEAVEEIAAETKTDEIAAVSELPDFDFDLLESAPQTQNDEDDEAFSFLDETPAEETAGLPEDIDIDLSNLDLILSEDDALIAASDTPEKQEPAAEDILAISDDDFAFLNDDTETQHAGETIEPASVREVEPESEAAPPPEEMTEPEIFAPLEEVVEEEAFEPLEEIAAPEIFAQDDIVPLEEIESPEKRRRLTAAVITCVICALLCVGALVVVCFFLPPKSRITEKIDIQVDEPVEVTSQAVETPVLSEPPIDVEIKDVLVEPEVIAVKPEPAVPVPPETPDAVRYRLKWGDTLWKLAGTYYDNPWLYRRIAQYNGIKNPALIVSGTEILIPQR